MKKESIRNLAEQWEKMTGIAILVMDKTGQEIYRSKYLEIKDRDGLLSDYPTDSGHVPVIKIWGNLFAWSLFRDTEENCYLYGPVAVYTYKKADYWNFKTDFYMDCDMKALPVFPLFRWQIATGLLFHTMTGKMLQQDDIVKNLEKIQGYEYESEHYKMEQTENEKVRNTYGEILPLLEAVRHGDRDAFIKNYDITLPDRIGKLAESSVKQTEYLTVKVISLFMHAMIDGGVDYNCAYDSSDIFLQKLEKAKGIEDMLKLQYEYIELAIDMVHQSTEQKKQYDIVEETKNYIVRHLNKRFTIEEMAKEMNVNASYLSRRFSQKEGMTIQRYIYRERVHAASNMLKFSDYSVSQIANYLCFSSQSHFSSLFHKEMGMTPSEYRKAYGQTR